MPHIANLPWLESYCSVIIILIIITSILFFSLSTLSIQNNTTNISRNNYWNW